MPVTGQVYQRLGSGICVQGVKDWNRHNLRHRNGTIVHPYGYYPFGERFKGVKVNNPREVRAVYDDVGRNQAMLFSLSQLANQASLCSIPFIYLAYNGNEDPSMDPVLFYKNIGVRTMGWNRVASRIKRGGASCSKVIVECIGDLNLEGMATGLINKQEKITGKPEHFGIESIRFEVEVSLEWKKKKSRDLMKIKHEAIKGVFTIRLNGQVDPRIGAYRGGTLFLLG